MKKDILKLLAHILRGIHEDCGQLLLELSSIFDRVLFHRLKSGMGFDDSCYIDEYRFDIWTDPFPL